MIIDGVRVVYTKEDEQGFTFRQIDAEDAVEMLAAKRKRRNLTLLVGVVLILVGFILNVVLNFDGKEIFVDLYYVLVIGIVGVYVYIDNANIKQLKNRHLLQYDIVLLEKLPVEEIDHYGADNFHDIVRVYPVRCRDDKSGYESVCYISEKDYKDKRIGDVITVTRFLGK